MQKSILEQYPSAELRVYTVWVPMLWEDSRSAWDSRMMLDACVTQFWDEQQSVAQWFAQQVDGDQGTAWDIYYLYGPEAPGNQCHPHYLDQGVRLSASVKTLKPKFFPFCNRALSYDDPNFRQ